MKKYILKTKCGDIISRTKANNINEAQDFFSKTKNLSISNLLEIFLVEESKWFFKGFLYLL